MQNPKASGAEHSGRPGFSLDVTSNARAMLARDGTLVRVTRGSAGLTAVSLTRVNSNGGVVAWLQVDELAQLVEALQALAPARQ